MVDDLEKIPKTKKVPVHSGPVPHLTTSLVTVHQKIIEGMKRGMQNIYFIF